MECLKTLWIMYKNVNIYNKRNGKYMKKRIIVVVLIIAIIQSFGMCVFANTIDELKQKKKETDKHIYLQKKDKAGEDYTEGKSVPEINK